MSSPAFARPNRSPSSGKFCRKRRPSCAACARRSKSIIATCRTSSSPLKTASSGCCKRAPASAPALPRCGIAVDMVEEQIIDRKEALRRIEPDQLNQLLRPIFDQKGKEKAHKAGGLLGKGLPAGPGAATGRVVFQAEDAVEWKKRGERVILCRDRNQPRRHSRHGCGAGNFHRPRRHDLPCRAGRAPDGQSLRRRLRGLAS